MLTKTVAVWDSDPDVGRPRVMTYEVLHVTGPGSMSLVGDMRQKLHPVDALRRQMPTPDDGVVRRRCRTVGCRNWASGDYHADCSTCRSKRVAKCACGRRRSYGAARCGVCDRANRKIRAQARFRVAS